jgi:hypothetical protein
VVLGLGLRGVLLGLRLALAGVLALARSLAFAAVLALATFFTLTAFFALAAVLGLLAVDDGGAVCGSHGVVGVRGAEVGHLDARAHEAGDDSGDEDLGVLLLHERLLGDRAP